MEFKDQVAVARDIIILLAILMFASGWMMAYFYFQEFGLSLNAISLPIYSFYLYSLVPIQFAIVHPDAWSVSLVVVVAVSLVLLLRFKHLRIVVLVLGFIVVLANIFPLTWEAAKHEAQCTRFGGGNRAVDLVLQSDYLGTRQGLAREEFGALQLAIETNSAVLIAETSASYFFLYQPKLEEARSSGSYLRAPVFRIPVGAVSLARTTAPALPENTTLPLTGACDA